MKKLLVTTVLYIGCIAILTQWIYDDGWSYEKLQAFSHIMAIISSWLLASAFTRWIFKKEKDDVNGR